MNRFRRFMYGRYGVDKLTYFLLAVSAVFTVLGTIFSIYFLEILGLLTVTYSLFRTYSRNTYKRSMENMIYLNIIYRIKNKFYGKKQRFEEKKTHKFYKCPTCSQELRVPKNKGKIIITCPKCQTKFEKRT